MTAIKERYSLRHPLKNLEKPFVYDLRNDELYELDETSYKFLSEIEDLDRPLTNMEKEFVEYCLQEGILRLGQPCTGEKTEVHFRENSVPSLRYLEFQITDRCNLQCLHCYMGKPENRIIEMEDIKRVFNEFEALCGLKMIISGGEPMLHPSFMDINSIISTCHFRSVLLTNGMLITKQMAKQLNFHEVQISIDGLEETHDSIRGRGSFKKAALALEALAEQDLDISIATVIYKGNTGDLERLSRWFKEINVKNWILDVPSVSGYLKENMDIMPACHEAGEYLAKYGFGGGLYHSASGYACGSHLCTINPDGSISKCGFYADQPVGTISDGIEYCFSRIPKTRLEELDCIGCKHVDQCRGGCRFRAETDCLKGKCDTVLCFANNGLCERR